MSNLNENEKKKAKIMLTVSNELNEKFVKFAKELGIPKTQMIIMATNWYINTQQALELMPGAYKAYEEMKEKGEIK